MCTNQILCGTNGQKKTFHHKKLQNIQYNWIRVESVMEFNILINQKPKRTLLYLTNKIHLKNSNRRYRLLTKVSPLKWNRLITKQIDCK